MISYLGQTLYFPDAGLSATAWAALRAWEAPEWPVDVCGTLPPGVRPSGVLPPDPLALGRLRWPRDASRFATFHALVDTAGLNNLRARAYGPYRAGPLVLDDGAYRVQAPMWLLPPRPLRQSTDNRNESWLVTLVDDRFFWWQRAADIEVTDGVTTWEDLYAAVGAALGVTVVADDVPAAYLKPPASLTSVYEYLPPLLDAVAFNVGQRIVCGLDGAVRAMNALSSRAVVQSNLAQRWPYAAGGRLAISWS